MSGALSRRDVLRAGGALLASRAAASPAREGWITRSNKYLEIGLNWSSGEAFIAVAGTHDRWTWNSNETVAAPSAGFPVLMDRDPLEPTLGHLRPPARAAFEELPDGFAFHYEHDWGRFRCTVRLVASEPDVVFQVEPDERYPCALAAIRFPGCLRPESGSATLVDSLSGGRLHRSTDSAAAWIMPADRFWMRFYGALGTESSYLAILEPGFDAALHYSPGARSAQDFGWIHMPALGTIDRNRAQRFRFLARSSYVDLARAYRRYAMAGGMYRSIKDKLEVCPSLRKLLGAVLIQIGYLHDPACDYEAAFRMLKSRGVEKAYVYPVNHFTLSGGREVYPGYRADYQWIELNDAAMRELDRLGYLYAPWTWMNEIAESSPYYHNDFVIHRPDGSTVSDWRIGKVNWFSAHEGRVLELLRQSAPDLAHRYTAFHFDVLNAGPCHENFAGPWTYTREQNSRYRTAMFDQFSRKNRVVGSEGNRDWAAPYKHFGTAKLDGPFGAKADFWPVPLWQLAFHDSVMTSWWEHSTYNDPDLGHDLTGGRIRHRMLLDMLTGDLPSVCPAGRMVGWRNPGKPDREMFDYRYNPNDPVTRKAIDAAVTVARFNAAHATDDLVHHKFLSEDGLSQSSVYASGTRVRVRLPSPDDATDRGELNVMG